MYFLNINRILFNKHIEFTRRFLSLFCRIFTYTTSSPGECWSIGTCSTNPGLANIGCHFLESTVFNSKAAPAEKGELSWPLGDENNITHKVHVISLATCCVSVDHPVWVAATWKSQSPTKSSLPDWLQNINDSPWRGRAQPWMQWTKEKWHSKGRYREYTHTSEGSPEGSTWIQWKQMFRVSEIH